jgi:threonine dehydratase
MPTFAPEIKVENVTRLGAEVILYGNGISTFKLDFDEAKEECLRIVAEKNLTFISAFDGLN